MPPDLSAKRDVPAGTLEMLILQTISLGPMHGYGIAQHLERVSEGVLRAEQGSLYPALERLLLKGWAIAAWGDTPTRRKARYYTITDSGRRHLVQRLSEYETVSLAIARVMQRA
jgi:PadR family transcriptional regulator, regulatory protein PadR